MANESNKELTSVWTPANIVTCVRIVFIPVFMIEREVVNEFTLPYSNFERSECKGGTGCSRLPIAKIAARI